MSTPDQSPTGQSGPHIGQTDTRRLRVFRYKRGDGRERFDEFEVPVGPQTTVLDALRWIQLHRDPTLTLRHSCMHASCGTCGLQVDGREELACVCAIQDHGAEIMVEPLANLPILTDLVVQMEGFFARFPHEHPIIRSSEPPPDVEHGDPMEAHHAEVLLHHRHRAAPLGADFMRLEDCIECGLCLSACPVASTSHEYVGPAALAAAERLLEEPRGVRRDDVLAWASRPEGVWRCHIGFECTQACPTDAIPAERIMALRRELTFAHHGHEERER